MAANNYGRVLAHTLAEEGGWANHPRDPGGATMRGVTQARYDQERDRAGLPRQSVRLISEAELQHIYRTGYWDPIKGDLLPMGPDLSTFDSAVNSGKSRGAKWLQRAAGAAVDGVVGPLTIRAVLDSDPVAIVKRMCEIRMGFLRGLATFDVFGRGWSRLVADVEAVGVSMALEGLGASSTSIQDHARAEAKDAERAKKAETGKAAGGAAVTTGSGAGTQAPDQITETPGLDAIPADVLPWILGAIAIVAAVLTIRAVWRRKVQKEREAAFQALAEDRRA